MTSTVVVGGFFGDEGKGKIISYLAIKDDPKIIVRGGAGPNAGHTIMDGDKVYKVRMLPSGFLNKNAKVMIGPGVVINPEVLDKEIQDFGASGRVFIDKHCGIIEESHLMRDSKGELKEKIGSTGSGTGPANSDRAMRVLKMAKDFDSLSSLITDVPYEINSALNANQNVWAEQAKQLMNQGFGEMSAEIFTFVWSHYYFSTRNDTEFWKEIREQKIEDRPRFVKEILDAFLPSPKRFLHLTPSSMFCVTQWFSMLHAGGAYEGVESKLTDKQKEYAEYFCKSHTARIEIAKDMFANHYDYLKEWYGR